MYHQTHKIPDHTASYRVICSEHKNEIVKRVCTATFCPKRILICPECIYDDPDHIKEHHDHIVPVADFVERIDEANKGKKHKRIFEKERDGPVNEIPKEIQELMYNDDKLMKDLRSHMNHQKLLIEEDINTLYSLFVQSFNEKKNQFYKELDDYINMVQNQASSLKQAAMEYYGISKDGTAEPTLYTKDILAQKAMEMNGKKEFDDFLKKARDNSFSKMRNVDSKPPSIFESSRYEESLQKFKKMINNPPYYKEGDQAEKIYNEVIKKIPLISDDVFEKFREMMSFVFLNEVEKFTPESMNSVKQGQKAAQLQVLEKLRIQKYLTINTSHSRQVNCICVLNENEIATGSSDNQIMIWDLTNGEHKCTFQGHKGPIVSMSLCNLVDKTNGSINYLASGSTDRNVILWNLEDESDTLALKGHEDSITFIMSLSDGNSLLTASADRKIILWDIVESKLRSILPCNGSVYQMVLTADETSFISCDYSQALNIWRIEYKIHNHRKVVENIVLERVLLTSSRIVSLGCSLTNKNLLVAGSEDKKIKFFDLSIEFATNLEECLIKEMEILNGEVSELIIVENSNSSKDKETLNVLAFGNKESRIAIVSFRRKKPIEVEYVPMGYSYLKNVFASHKAQLFKSKKYGDCKVALVSHLDTHKEVTVFKVLQADKI